MSKVLTLNESIREDIKTNLKDYMSDYVGTYGCDLANKMYNEDYYIIGYNKAKEFLKENFDEMLETLEDYESNFGEQYKDITDVEKLATLVALHESEKILNESEALNDRWNEELEDEDIEKIIKAI